MGGPPSAFLHPLYSENLFWTGLGPGQIRSHSIMKRAFTLIELLVVIAIIAILAAILFPVFAQAKAAAKKTACLVQAKQMGTAAHIYLTDYDDNYPINSYNSPSGFTYSNTHYWYFGLTFQDASLAKLLPQDGILYPYMKNKDIQNCPESGDIKPSSGGAPFTIDPSEAALGYDKNRLLVYSQTTPAGAYGPIRSATSWDNVSQSVLLADSAFSNRSSSFNGLNMPRNCNTGAANSASSSNIHGRHANQQANIVMQDTHAKSMKVNTLGNATLEAADVGILLGPRAPSPADPGANYYFVPDKSVDAPCN